MGAKYYLYRNLHTGGFSVKHKGRVCERADLIVMHDVEFRVSETGRQGVIKNKRKQVHAYMVADNYKAPITHNAALKSLLESADSNMTHITYNPYKNESFVNAETGEPILKADYAIAVNGKVYIR